MNILFIIDVFPSLSQTFILNQITGLIDRGHKVQILSANFSSDKVVHPDVEKYDLLKCTHYLNAPPQGFLKRIKGFLSSATLNSSKIKIIARSLNVLRFGNKALTLNVFYNLLPLIKAEKEFDIIHCQFGNLGKYGIFFKEQAAKKAKLVVSFRGYDITTLVYKNGSHIYDELFYKGDLFLPVCSYFKHSLIKLGCPEHKIKVHYSGIYPERFSFLQKFDGKRIDTKFKLITVGRLVEKKGIHFALHALKYLSEVRPELLFEYRIVGGGPLLETLKQEVVSLGLTNVEFCGSQAQPQVIALLQEADVFIAPHITASDHDQEGIPNVLKEAMAIGLPVISTFHSGIPELIEDKVSGFLVSEGDYRALAGKLEEVVSSIHDLDVITLSARNKIEDSFDIHQLNNALVRTYTSLIKVANTRIAATRWLS